MTGLWITIGVFSYLCVGSLMYWFLMYIGDRDLSPGGDNFFEAFLTSAGAVVCPLTVVALAAVAISTLVLWVIGEVYKFTRLGKLLNALASLGNGGGWKWD